jgi:rhodanese-related sulfurtransferase
MMGPGIRGFARCNELDGHLPAVEGFGVLADRGQKIFLTCGAGGKSTLCAKALGEMGFTDVWVIDGGCRGWKEAGYDVAVLPAP